MDMRQIHIQDVHMKWYIAAKKTPQFACTKVGSIQNQCSLLPSYFQPPFINKLKDYQVTLVDFLALLVVLFHHDCIM